MRIRRVRQSQIIWRQQSIGGVANSAVAVRVFAGRHKPIVWKQKPLAGTVSGATSETATLTDAVSATYVGNVSTAESVTLSETDAYPVTTFAQTIYRGRNPPIAWRQTESIATGTSLSGSFSDAMVITDFPASSQDFAVDTVLESFTVTDTSDPLGGASVVSIVEAETVEESVDAVWDVNSDLSESLSPVDAMEGDGGTPVLPPVNDGQGPVSTGEFGYLNRNHRRKKELEPVPEVLAPAPSPSKTTVTKRDIATAKKQIQEDEDAAIRKLLTDLLKD